jgi:hypothetical protein
MLNQLQRVKWEQGSAEPMEKYLQLVRGFLLTNTEALAILTRNPELKDVEEVSGTCPTFAKIVRFSDRGMHFLEVDQANKTELHAQRILLKGSMASRVASRVPCLKKNIIH